MFNLNQILRRTILVVIALFSVISSKAQFNLSGNVYDQDGKTLVGATVQILNTYRAVSTDLNGHYAIPGIEADSVNVKVSYIGYETKIQLVILQKDTKVDFSLNFSPYMSDEFTVIGTRLNQETPMVYSTIDKKEIVAQNVGQDMPELLSITPSVVFTSDAGNGVGYTYMRMRGSDQTNINVTINGIPLNDPESQQVFWVDLPDLSSSTQNIQVQRGVGTSTNGAGAFGGSVNLLTEDVSTKPYAEVNLAYGSFNTLKTTFKLGSGILNEHWTIAGRGSFIQSDGYMDRSETTLGSYYGALQYSNAKTGVRFIAFGGNELSHQAWNGVPSVRLENDVPGMLEYAAASGWGPMHTQNLLDSDRRYNYYLFQDEVDDYSQYHNQLHINHELNDAMVLNVSGFYTKGKGYFEQYQYEENAYDQNAYADYGIPDPIIGGDTITNANIIRQRWLDNDFYGGVFNLRYHTSKWNADFGGSFTQYNGSHFGDVIWATISTTFDAPYQYYSNSSLKNDFNIYAKAMYAIDEIWSVYGDLQYRFVDYSYLGVDNDGGELDQRTALQFFNPKAGVNAQINPTNRLFVSFAVGNKEPNRDDYIVAPPDDKPLAQTLYDLELGYTIAKEDFIVSFVLYNMQYKNQLINTGELNDVGAEVRTNVPNSYRRGIELNFNYNLLNWLNWSANATGSINKIEDYSEYIDNWDTWEKDTLYLGTTNISFSPSFIVGSNFTFSLFKSKKSSLKKQSLSLSVISKYVSKQYLDNTSDDARSIPAYFVNDLRLNYSLEQVGFRNISVIALVRNLFDVDYVSNGWVYKYQSGDQLNMLDGLFPQAGINYMIGLNLQF
jgi:iron complex outermembrane receptor protein